jgi:hypothetical protein
MDRRAVYLLPADVLDVIVAANREVQATLQASALEHLAAIGRGHALTKTVHTHAPADLWLISTFGCHSLTPKKTDYCLLHKGEL